MNVKSITAVVLVAMLATAARSGADEPPAWARPAPPQHAAGEELRSGGILLTGAGTVLMVALAGVIGSRVIGMIETAAHGCYLVGDGSDRTTCDYPADHGAEIGLAIAGGGALSIGLPLLLVGEQKAKRNGKPRPELRLTTTASPSERSAAVALRVRF